MSDYDAVVLGAGLAGLSAAATLIEGGARVLVLEKTLAGGGSTAMSGGWFAWSGTPEQRARGIADDDETFVRDMRVTGGGRADPQLLDAYVEHQREADQWARERLGVVYDVVTLSAGQSVPRSHHADIGLLLKRLHDVVPVVRERRATRFITDAGRVVGVEHGPGTITGSSAVVLATGGFSRSTDLLNRFAPKQLAAIPHGGQGNTGDGLHLAEEVGAELRDVDHVGATFGSHPSTPTDRHELLTAFYLGAIIVNRSGERFVDESRTYKEIGTAALDQPGAIGFQVFDQQVRDRSRPGVPLSDIADLESRGLILRADSLPDLAREAGIDADALVRTVHRYNDSSMKDDVGRASLCNGTGTPIPLVDPPFYAYPSRPLMTSTFGGVRVSPATDVLNHQGLPIPGLFAAGEVTGGFHGSSYLTGTALGKALIFGRRAGLRVLAGL